MTFKVTANDQSGRPVIRRGLTEKEAHGLCSDYRTCGFRNITIAAETNEADLANRHAWQVLAVAVCILGFIIAIFINFLLG